MRPLTMLAVALVVAVAAGLFLLEDEVRRLERALAELQATVAAEREAIHVLKAEWSFLNRPARLEALAGDLLELGPVTPGQLATVSDVPARIDDLVDGGSPTPALAVAR